MAPAADPFDLSYELPLNERIRTILRLEHLFGQANSARERGDPLSNHAALAALIDVLDIITRIDVKSELVKELDRINGVLRELGNNPGVQLELLNETIATVDGLLAGLKAPAYQPGARLKNDELIAQIRQRISIPGGLCPFDVPSLHHWLNQPADFRRAAFDSWCEDLTLIRDSCLEVLSLLRTSTVAHRETATAGFFQYNNEDSHPLQLVRVMIHSGLGAFPEISGGKHRFTIRFLEQHDTGSRPQQTDQDVTFALQVCWL